MSQPPQTLTVTETHALLASIMGQGGTHKQYRRRLRNYTIAMLMLEAGLRVGEVVKCPWSALFFNSLPVTSIIITPQMSKSDRERQIPVSTRLSNALSTYHEYNAPDFSAPAAQFAFYTAHPLHPLTTRQVERIITAAAKESLGRPVHPHVLRHTFASKLMRVTNASVVQALLGHKHLSSTQVYCHPNNDDLKGAIDSLTDLPQKFRDAPPPSD